jgi:hypothetical protein
MEEATTGFYDNNEQSYTANVTGYLIFNFEKRKKFKHIEMSIEHIINSIVIFLLYQDPPPPILA